MMGKLYVFPLARVVRLIYHVEHEYDPACICNHCTAESLFRINGSLERIDGECDRLLEEWADVIVRHTTEAEKGDDDGSL